MRSMLWMAMLLAVGCTGDDDGQDDDTKIPGTSGNCGATSPVIEDLWVENGGMHEFEQGVEYPSIMVWADAYDPDGDLTYYTMKVWFDEVVDGRVLAEGESSEVYGTIDGSDCKVFSAQLGMRLAVTDSSRSPNVSTETEFGVVILDEEDHESGDGEPLETVFFTPDAEGNVAE